MTTTTLTTPARGGLSPIEWQGGGPCRPSPHPAADRSRADAPAGPRARSRWSARVQASADAASAAATRCNRWLASPATAARPAAPAIARNVRGSRNSISV